MDTEHNPSGNPWGLDPLLADRSLFQPSSSALTPDSPFPYLVAYWLEALELEDRISKHTLA